MEVQVLSFALVEALEVVQLFEGFFFCRLRRVPPVFGELFEALLGEPVTFDGPTEKWIVWPAAGAGPDPRHDELQTKGIRVVGYEADGDGYRFRVGAKA